MLKNSLVLFRGNLLFAFSGSIAPQSTRTQKHPKRAQRKIPRPFSNPRNKRFHSPPNLRSPSGGGEGGEAGHQDPCGGQMPVCEHVDAQEGWRGECVEFFLPVTGKGLGEKGRKCLPFQVREDLLKD